MARRLRIGEVVALLEAEGWARVRAEECHQQFRHERKAGVVTLSGRDQEGMPRHLVRTAFRRAGVPWIAGIGR
jgi:predicted RNA binding protein YcfA (HicA-like mRNA interferase family)